MMTFFRLIEDKLIKFKNEKHAKPQVIFGVRQCGKTTTILKHAENYENLIYINFESDVSMQSYFETCNLHPEDIIAFISLTKNIEYKGTNTLIVFDEIQASNRALTSLKYFAEAKEEYKIIASGSLLGTKIYRETFSFPVSKVNLHTMYPLNFTEFLYATKNERFIPVIEQALKTNTLNEEIHKQILGIFDIYSQIGGMPEVVAHYINTNDSTNISTIHNNLHNGYLADMTKYATASNTHKIRQVYDNLSMQLGKDNQKFILRYLEKGATMRKFEDSIDWLIAAQLAIKVSKVSCVNQPLMANVDKTHFKLFSHDIGMLNSQCSYNIATLTNKDRIYLGIVMENFAAMELSWQYEQLFYFDDGKKEIDYLVKLGNDIIPLEIKASNNVKSKSLHVFMQMYDVPFGLRASRKNFGYVNNIKSIPLYALGFINQIEK